MGLFNKKHATVDVATEPTANETIPAEVVAAIAGAVAVMCGGEARVTGVRRVSSFKEAGRSAWSLAGLMANTRPFNA